MNKELEKSVEGKYVNFSTFRVYGQKLEVSMKVSDFLT
jgi:hypothetical protein